MALIGLKFLQSIGRCVLKHYIVDCHHGRVMDYEVAFSLCQLWVLEHEWWLVLIELYILEALYSERHALVLCSGFTVVLVVSLLHRRVIFVFHVEHFALIQCRVVFVRIQSIFAGFHSDLHD